MVVMTYSLPAALTPTETVQTSTICVTLLLFVSFAVVAALLVVCAIGGRILVFV